MVNVLSRDIVQLKMYSFQRTYNWEVLMPFVGYMPGEMVAPLIQTVEYDDYNMAEAAAMKAGPYFKFYPRDFQKPTLSMTFIETEAGLVKSYFAFWRTLIVNQKGLWGKRSSYAKDIILTYLTSKGYPLRQVTFKEAFPLKSYSAKLSYEDNGVLKVEVPFSCDRVQEGLIGTVGGPFSLENSPFSGLKQR